MSDGPEQWDIPTFGVEEGKEDSSRDSKMEEKMKQKEKKIMLGKSGSNMEFRINDIN